jgi:signal transduction histidine kinase
LETTLRELQTAQTQLVQSEKMTSLGMMVAGVAHEINNPVNFIHGNLTHADEYIRQLIEHLQLYRQEISISPPNIAAHAEENDLDFIIEDLPNLLASMKVGTQRIREIVRSLRNFSRLDESQMKSVDIHEGIDSTLLIVQNRLKAKPNRPEIKLIKDYGDLPPVECYASKLNQVFMNLLVNAIDALEMHKRDFTSPVSHPHSPLPVIRIRSATIDKNTVAISISDNGCGIPPDVKSRLFDPFFTTKPMGKGTGLGLAISHQIIVEKHGGKLHCLSEPEQGTEFVIELPIRQLKVA